MAMAIPAAEAAGSVGAKAAGGGAAKKAAAKKAAPQKVSANPSKMASETNTKINSGQGPAKTTTNPGGDALAITEVKAERDKAKAQSKAGGGEGEQRARNREARAAESHANRQADRQAKAKTGKTGASKKVVGWAFSGDRKLLTVEFIVCLVVLGLGTLLAPQGSKDGMPRAMVKGSALSGLFLVLALVASGGKGAAKVATGIGTLVTASYLFTSSDVHNVTAWVASFFSKTGDVSGNQPIGSGPGAADAGAVAGAVGEVAGGLGQVILDQSQQGVLNPDGTYTSPLGFTY